MFEFRNPEFFILIPLILFIFFWQYKTRAKKIATLKVSSLRWFQGIPSQRKSFYWPTLFKFFALILILIALARPQESSTKSRNLVEGIDIVIALDVSDSMLIEDMRPTNRLESAKKTIQEFIQKRTSDRIGLVIFAGEAFTQVPPTLDYPVLLKRVQEITTAANANIKDGTALGVALASAAGRLKDSKAKTRVVIFMTDGENNSGTIDPETGLEIAKGYGLKVYTIGIGKDGPTRLPIYQRDVFGQNVKTYVPFESTVNEELLKFMATSTGGAFFRASQEDSLKGVFQKIDQLEKTKIDTNRFTRYKELYDSFLWIGLILYLLAFLLPLTVFKRWP